MTRTEQIAALYQRGKGQREIGRLLGISQPAVRKHLLREGLLAPRHSSVEQLAETPDHRKAVVGKKGEHKSDLSVGTTEITHRAVLLPETVHCGFCKGIFPTSPLGQRYCCNACGARAAGYKPVVEHTVDCLRLVDNH